MPLPVAMSIGRSRQMNGVPYELPCRVLLLVFFVAGERVTRGRATREYNSLYIAVSFPKVAAGTIVLRAIKSTPGLTWSSVGGRRARKKEVGNTLLSEAFLLGGGRLAFSLT